MSYIKFNEKTVKSLLTIINPGGIFYSGLARAHECVCGCGQETFHEQSEDMLGKWRDFILPTSKGCCKVTLGFSVKVIIVFKSW